MKRTFFNKKLVIVITVLLLVVTIGVMNVAGDENSSMNKKIIFASDRSGNWDIWSMNIDGTELTQLTSDEGPDVAPDISPDGRKIAFVSGRTGYPQPWLKDLGSGEEYQLFDVLELPIPYTYPKKIRFIKWHPSGDYIIAKIDFMGGVHPWPWAVMYRCDPDGSNVKEFLGLGPSIKGKWDISSDGNRLAYCRENSNYNAYTLKITIGDIVNGIVDPSSLYNLGFTIDNKRDKGVSWYMNDEKLLWRKGKNPSNLFTANLDGSEFQQLTFFSSGGGVVQPEISPDENHVIYNLLIKGVHLGGYDWWGIDAGYIYMMDIDGSNTQLIIGNDGYYYHCPVWDPTMKVNIDIKPGSCPNPINLKSKGEIPVAICGTEDFDVTTIDPETILLTREGYEDVGVSSSYWSYEDVATPYTGEEECGCHDLYGDGYLDLTLKFKNQEVVNTLELADIAGETVPLMITGNLVEDDDGTPIIGQDCVWVLKNKEDTKERASVDANPIYRFIESFVQRFPLLRLMLSYLIF